MGGTRQKIVGVAFVVFAGVLYYQLKIKTKPLRKTPDGIGGSWKTACLPKSGDHFGPHRFHITFKKGLLYDSYYTLYLDSKCRTKLTIHSYEGSFAIVPNDSLGSEAYELDYQVSKAHITMVHRKAVANARKKKLYGYSNWAQGTPVRISGMEGWSYDIAKVEDNSLRFGDRKSGDQTSSRNRPIEFEDHTFKRLGKGWSGNKLLSDAQPQCVQDYVRFEEEVKKLENEAKDLGKKERDASFYERAPRQQRRNMSRPAGSAAGYTRKLKYINDKLAGKAASAEKHVRCLAEHCTAGSPYCKIKMAAERTANSLKEYDKRNRRSKLAH